jgi:hypothetical protein
MTEAHNYEGKAKLEQLAKRLLSMPPEPREKMVGHGHPAKRGFPK